MAATDERIASPARRRSGPDLASGIYECRVTHRRFFPVSHRFTYGVWYLLADLDELPALDRTMPGFGYERPAPVSFYASDHGPRDGSDLRRWIEGRLAQAGIVLDGGAVRLLCFPRVFGYTFNPISVWFCHGPDGGLRAILYEVTNTFGDWHHYLVPVTDPTDGAVIRSGFDKELFVSPFIDMAAAYDFRTRIPDDRIAVLVRQLVPGGQVLVATLTGRRRPPSGRTLARVLARYPWVTAKVTLGIHLEAMRLHRKGAPYRRRGAPPAVDMTIVGGTGEDRVER
jgi:uncharacterized protein